MHDHIRRPRAQLMALISLTFLLTPAIGLGVAALFSLLQWEQLIRLFQFGLLPTLLGGMLALSTTYFWRFLNPLSKRLHDNPKHSDLALILYRRVQRFKLVYWGLMIANALCVSLTLLYSMRKTGMPFPTSFVWQLFGLQVSIALLMGMPAFLLGQDKLSQISEHAGLFKVQNTLHSKLLLLGGLLPVLSCSLLLQYHWIGNGRLEISVLITWAALCAITVFLTLLTIRSLRRSLLPVQQALQSSGAVTHQSLAGLKAHSIDEIGYLSQALGKVFHRLVDQGTRIRAIIDNAAEGIIVTDEQGMIDTFNLAAQNLFNYNGHEVRGKPLSWLLQDMLDENGTARYRSGRYNIKGIKRDGSMISISVCVSAINLSGKPVFIYLVNDLSETEAALGKLQQAEAMYRDLVETAHDLVWSMDGSGHWTYLNEASIQLYGYKPEEMIGMPVSDFRHPDYAELEQHAFSDISHQHELYQFETIHRDRHGKDICLSFNARAQFDRDGNITLINGTARDITATKKYQRQLSYQAEHDALTGLYNRRFFQQELDRLIARSSRSSETSGLLYIDLDQFKYINDTLGHAAGDQLLVEISNMISAHAREGDLFARFGGDEFTLLLYDIEADNLEKAAENFRHLFDDFVFYHEGKGFSVSCSIGVSLIDASTGSSDQAMSQADLACNLAKTRGRNCVNIYKPDDRDEEGMADDMGWAARVKDMIDNDRFILAYQPIMETQTRKIIDYELLLRMPTDDGKIILPGGFMPAAERFGLINRLDNWMIQNAIKRLADMHQQGIKAHFSINLSDKALDDEGLLERIKQGFEVHGLDPSFIHFEIAETAILTDLARATDFLAGLRALGCQCTLDDFGAGFCSFGYLKDLPIDRVKIDGSVISDIATNPVDRTMVQSMNQIAHVLGLVTVAECVENAQTLDTLKEIGVDFVQGHHIGRPVQDIAQVHAQACRKLEIVT